MYDGTTNGKAENITLNQDGSFSYNATKDTIGKITYKYYVKTTVTIPTWLDTFAKEKGINCSKVFQDALLQIVLAQ